MLLLCSHFTEEEIKAQRSLSNLHEIKHPIGGSSEGVFRSKNKIWKRRTAWIKQGHGTEHSARRERRRVWVCWNDVWWGSWRRRQRVDLDRSLFTSLCMLERHWRGLSKTHDQTWRSKSWRDGKRKWDTGEQDWPLLVCKEPPVQMHSNCSDLFCFPQSTDMISSHKKPSVSTLLWHVSFDIMSQRSHFKVLFESQNWETAKQCPGMQTNADGQILCLGNKCRLSMMEEVYWVHFLL